MINLYKPISKTPLELVQELRKREAEYQDKKLAYAGRLDPMAQGVLLVLEDEECKQRVKYQNLDKEYEYQVLFGISSDSYDVMGMPKVDLIEAIADVNLDELADNFSGKLELYYPPFSSKPVNGKPLFAWAKENRLDEIKLPESTYEIISNEFIDGHWIKAEAIIDEIEPKIAAVKGDFRQAEIIQSWRKLLKDLKGKELFIAKFKAEVQTGAYIRVIAHEMGKELGGGALAWSILRTRVGNYKLEDSLSL